MAGFCRTWIPGFGLTVKPLYEAIKGPDMELLLWNGEQKSFNNIKQALTRALALGLLSLEKPFILYMAERQGTALGGPYTEARGSSSA